MFTMNNKKQPPEVLYKKAVLKKFSIFTGKYLCSSLFLIKLIADLQVCNYLKKKFHCSCFSVNIAKFLEKLILKKICERLLLNNVKRNYSSRKIAKQMLNICQHSQENTFTGVSFLINIVAACNLSLSLFKKRFRHWCFPDSYLNFLTTTFLKREKKHCYKKRGSYIYRKSNFLCNFAKISVFQHSSQ